MDLIPGTGKEEIIVLLLITFGCFVVVVQMKLHIPFPLGVFVWILHIPVAYSGSLN